MSLRFVTGEKKTGKTTFLLEEIKQKIQSKKQVIYIVPEQMVFRAEAYILDRLGEQQAFLVETLSFSKLAASLLRKRPDLKLLQLLDSCSKKLILHKVMGGLKDRLSVYAGASSNPRMIALLSENITELKKYGVDEKRLEEILQEQDLSDNLRRKLTDIREILHSYEQELCGLYQDHDDMLTMACRELDAGELEDADVYIDGFVGFTLQEAQMIGSLLTHQNRVTVTLTMTPEEDSYYGKRFYTTWLTREKLSGMARDAGVPVEKIALEQKRFEREEIRFLSENLFLDDYRSCESEPEHIVLEEYPDMQRECEGIAADILRRAAEQGVRFGETAVIVPDPEEYRPYLAKAFGNRQISYYLDGKEDIVRLPIVRLISNVLSVCVRRNDRRPYFFYLKSGFFYPEAYDKILRFENFVLENGVRSYDLADGNAFQKALERAEIWGKCKDSEELREVYDRVFAPLNRLSAAMNRKSTAAEKSALFYEFMNEAGIPQFIDRTANRQKQEGDQIGAMQTLQAYNAVCFALEKTALVLGDGDISLAAYQEILKEAIRDETVSTIPLGFDSVMVTGLGRLKSNDYKVIYFAGLNEGKIPGSFRNEGLINETDRMELAKYGLELSKGNQLKIVDEYTEIYEIMSSPAEELILSYPVTASSGEALKPSMLIGEVRAIFPRISVRKIGESLRFTPKDELFDRAAEALCEKQNGGLMSVFLQDEDYRTAAQTAFDHYFHNKEPETVDEKLVKKLYPNKLETSVSRLEKYRSCHFAYFMDYMLKAQDVEELKPDPLSMGSMLHSVIEQFSRTAKRIGYDTIDEAFIRSETDKLVDKLLKDPKNSAYTLNRKNAYAVKKLKRVAARTLLNIKNHFEKSAFTPLGFEMSFGREDKELKGITLNLSNGCEVSLNGVIDRADRAEEFVRVVDYKSSGKELSANDIYHGLSLQLAVYLATLLKQNPAYRPGSMTYLAADDPMVSIRSMNDVRQVEEEIRSRFMMKGILLKDKTVLSMMDRELETSGKSRIVDASLKKDGEIQALKEKNMLTLGEFQLVLKRAVDMARLLCEDIYAGKTDAKPVKCGDKDGCRYCGYNHICGFDPKRDTPEELPKLSKDEVLGRLRGSKEEESE
ncbi:PD-(D/E)XK nuclease family protein [Acetivibrio sp. MSJd-27]|uniref:PD-(D/E)XK nuclease family protein n=1 Tax=Acetivibrio sp. MSJd-27 TaxID=2841523 RepID=UPI001C122B63|nr:PD-(D/E)XK nuclease family protein [Acetivibrio sp. MSJd-27]MBU5451025.1 PD-(D/E)XK nuclease family protein [Acetivibrio sp. MSJd-27]